MNKIESRRPTKQMALQSGRVISINKSCDASTANFLSLDLESSRSETQTPLGKKAPQIPKPTLARHSTFMKDSLSEEALQTLTQQLRLSSRANGSHGLLTQERASIAEPLNIADNIRGSCIFKSVDLPKDSDASTGDISPLTKSRRISSTQVNGRTSRLSTRSLRDSLHNPKKNSRSFKLELKDLNSRPSSWDLSFEALTRSVTRPISKLVAEKDQLIAPDESDEDPNRTSFFSNSPSSSVASQPITPLRSVSSPSPMGQNLFDRNVESRLSNRSSRPPGPTCDLPIKRRSSLVGTASICRSLRDTQDLQRVFSVMSNDSALTFAASDISSTFSLGNARTVPITQPSAVLRSPLTPATPLTPITPGSRYSQRQSTSNRRSKRFAILPPIDTAL